MRTLIIPLLTAGLAWSVPHLGTAADAPAPEMAKAQEALSGTDAQAKRSALRALGSSSVGKDEEVFPLLIGAIADRQGGETAVSALTSRAGKTAKGGSWAAGKEPSNIQAAWNEWYDDYKTKQRVKKLDKKDEKKPVALAPVETPKADTGEKTAAPKPAEDLGKMDRVSFKAGGSLLCYIMAKRTDADGNLISLRVVHTDGAGEETISATLISRIEEDIR